MGILIAFLLALFITPIFLPSGNRGIASFLVFFFLLVLAGIASTFWIVPVGPALWGVSWLPMLFFILIMAFLFSAPSPRQKSDTVESAAVSFGAISIFIWFLFVILLTAII